jgi:hypothetical protein
MWIVYRASYVDGRSYVGQTMRSLQDRMQGHYNSNNTSFGVFLQSTDIADWTWEVLKRVDTAEEAFHWEAYYMFHYEAYLKGFNGITGNLGRLTEQSKKEMSEKRKGKNPWNKGKTGVYSEETIRMFSISALGRLSKRSEEGENRRLEGIKKLGRPVKNLETNEIYSSVGETARKLGAAHSTVKRILNGKIKNSFIKINYANLC